MKGSKILLLLLILGFGAGIELAYDAREHLAFGPAGCSVLGGGFYGPSYSFESELRQEVPADTRLSVSNAFGDIAVSAGGPGEVGVKLRTVVYLSRESAARDFASLVRARAELVGAALRVSTNRGDLRGRNVGFETHLEVRVPAGTAVEVADEHGAVSVKDVGEAVVETSYDALEVENVAGAARLANRHGAVTARGVAGALSAVSRYGDVDLSEVGGPVRLEVEHGDVSIRRAATLQADLGYGDLTAETLGGDLVLRGRHAGVTASDLTGSADVQTSYRDVRVARVSGAVRLEAEHAALRAEDVQGALTAGTTYGDVALARVAGPAAVKVVHGGLRAERLTGGGRIEVHGDDVDLDGFRGVFEVKSRGGNVHLVPDGAATDDLTVDAANGSIRLEVPEGSRFDLTASARSGEVAVDVPGLAVSEASRGRVVGKLGGGGRPVLLSADHGDVSVGARVVTAEGTGP